jgi:WD40 repeat protein
VDGDAPPAEIGRYQVLGERGRGGMGVVYEAWDPDLRRRVALKRIHPARAAESRWRSRFTAEAQLLARLGHPNIVHVYEVGESHDLPFLAMECVDGPSLRDWLGAQPLEPRQAARLVEDLARAIEHAHRAGVIHRDLKPSNVLLRPDRNEAAGYLLRTATHQGLFLPKISDFGLATLRDRASTLTQTGELLGTPGYMAPEMAEGTGDPSGPTLDVYGLGTILYEVLTGHPPFVGTDPVLVLSQVRFLDPVSPRQLQPGVPRDLETICLCCLRKDPARRYSSAEALAADLRRFQAGEPVLARRPGAVENAVKWVRREPVVALLSAAVALALLLGIGFSTAFGVRADRHATQAEQNERRARDNEKKVREALLAVKQERDAKDSALRRAEGLRLIAQSESVRGANPALALLLAVAGGKRAPGLVSNVAMQEALDDCRERRVFRGHKGALLSASFSADGGKALTCSTDGTARIWDAATGKSLHTLPAPDVLQAYFSPDGRRVVTLSGWDFFRFGIPAMTNTSTLHWDKTGPTVRLWEANSGKLIARWQPPKPKWLYWVYTAVGASFSSDSRRVVTFFGMDRDGHPTVHDTRTGKRLAVLRGQTPVLAAAFSPTARTVATACADDTIYLWEADTGNLLRTLKGHRCNPGLLTFSPDGRRLLSLGTGRKYVVRNGVPNLPEVADDSAGRVWDVATGKQLAALKWPDTGRTPFATGAFQPDGRHVTLADGYRGRRVWDAQTGEPRPSPEPARLALPGHPGAARVAVGPDGVSVLYADSDRVARLLADRGTADLRGHDDKVHTAVFRRDGKAIITASADGTARLWEAPLPGLLEPPPGAYWATPWTALTPDGRRLFVRRPNGPGAMLIDANTGRERARLDSFLWDSALSEDGRKVVALASKGPSADQARSVLAIDTGTGKGTVALKASRGRLAALSANGRLALLDHRDPTRPHEKDDRASVWDLVGKKRLAELTGPQGAVGEAVFSPDGRRLLAGQSQVLPVVKRVWDTRSGKEVFQLGGGVQNLVWAAFADGGREVVALYWADVKLRTFDARTGKQKRTFTDRRLHRFCNARGAFPMPRVRLLQVSPDGQRVLCSPYGSVVAIWDLQSGPEPAVVLPGHTAEITFCRFSRDGRLVLTGSEDRTVRIWDAWSGKQKALLCGHEGAVTWAALSRDGQRLVTASTDRTVRVWDVGRRQELARLRWRHLPIEEVAFSADGKRVVVRGRDLTRLWDLDVLSAAWARLPRRLTPGERERYEVPGDE